jgi:aquaporin Z
MPYNFVQLLGGAAAAGAFRYIRSSEYDVEDPEDGHERLLKKLICEFIGTFFLVLTVGLNVLKGGKLDPEDPLNEAAVFSIAASLLCMIYAVGPISGAHLNPAVTLAIVVSQRNKISLRDAGLYMCTQVTAGLLASVFYVFIANQHAFDLGPYGKFSWSGVVVAEMVYTCLLCYVVLAVATVKDMSHSSDLFGLTIGFAIVAGGYAIGPVSGACLNPAVSIAIDTSYAVLHGGWWRCIAYTAIEFLGALVAAGTFRITHPDEFTDDKVWVLVLVLVSFGDIVVGCSDVVM